MRALVEIGRSFASHPLTRDRQLDAWSRFIAWQLRSRLRREIEIPWIGGQWLIMRRGMTGATGNLYFGLHEFMSMGLVLHFLREGDLFVDGGANVGSYTVLASGICRARTCAIEADEEAGCDLARNIEINRLGDLATVHVLAAGPGDGEVYFTVGQGAGNMVVVAAGDNVRTVAQKSIDSLVGDHVPAMIKLDVEDYEDQALRGASHIMKQPSLKVVVLEATTPWTLRLFADHGFERAFYDPFTRVLGRTPSELDFSKGRWTHSNYFFVRDWNFVERRLATAKPVTVLGRPV